jgi:hypothetical protein
MAKVTRERILALQQEKGFLNARLFAEHFDLPLPKAYQVLKACWDKGLLVPVDLAFFALPENDGTARFKSKSGQTQKESYYRPEFDAVRKLWEENPDTAFTLREVKNITQLDQARLRKVLYYMEETGEVHKAQADAGGMYGRPPLLFAKSYAALSSKNEDIVAKVRAKEQAKKKKKGNQPPPKKRPPIDGITWFDENNPPPPDIDEWE